MKGYLLDTNICIFAMRDKFGVNKRLESIDPQQCYVADVTVMELRFGAYKSEKSEENLRTVNNFLRHLSRIENLEIENWIQR